MHKVNHAFSFFVTKNVTVCHLSKSYLKSCTFWPFMAHGLSKRDLTKSLSSGNCYATAPPWGKSKGIFQQALEPVSCQDLPTSSDKNRPVCQCKDVKICLGYNFFQHQKISFIYCVGEEVWFHIVTLTLSNDTTTCATSLYLVVSCRS